MLFNSHLCFEMIYNSWFYVVLAVFGIKGIPGFGIGVVAETFLVTFRGQLDFMFSILGDKYMDLNAISKKVHNH